MLFDITPAKSDRNLKRLIVSHTLFSWTKKTKSLQPARMRPYTKIDKPRELIERSDYGVEISQFK